MAVVNLCLARSAQEYCSPDYGFLSGREPAEAIEEEFLHDGLASGVPDVAGPEFAGEGEFGR